MTERKLTPFHQGILNNLNNRKTREEFKDWSSRGGLLVKVEGIATSRHADVVDAVLARSEGRPLPHTGKKTLYYPPEILEEIMKEILTKRIASKERQNIEIWLSNLPK